MFRVTRYTSCLTIDGPLSLARLSHFLHSHAQSYLVTFTSCYRVLFTNVQITTVYPFTKLVSATKNCPFFFCIRKETSQILAKIQLYLSFRTLSRKYLVTIVRAFEESTYINWKNYTDAVAFIYHSYKNIDGNEFDLPNLSYQRGEENPCEGKNPCEPTGGKKYLTRERLLEGR